MTQMPQLVALFNGVGGGASALVAGQALLTAAPSLVTTSASAVSGVVGAVTLSGSVVATAKLAGRDVPAYAPKRARHAVLVVLSASAIALAAALVSSPGRPETYAWIVAVSLAFGLALVAPIGGGDMPVVIAFLNSCSGLAAAATGFVLMNQALVISGSLVGASGFILTAIMCRAMNRRLAHVLFDELQTPDATGDGDDSASGTVKSISPDEVAMLLESARRVVIVPGYGMAVAQAQQATAELSRDLQSRGITVLYAIHPVAGRMPGHMNVLLAEADVPYDDLLDLEAVNPELSDTDVVLVIGANDVVNPRARTDESSPIYGMPIVNVDQARTVVVLKRSLAAGFAGVSNPLFTADGTVMLFGDAKASVIAMTQALAESE